MIKKKTDDLHITISLANFIFMKKIVFALAIALQSCIASQKMSNWVFQFPLNEIPMTSASFMRDKDQTTAPYGLITYGHTLQVVYPGDSVDVHRIYETSHYKNEDVFYTANDDTGDFYKIEYHKLTKTMQFDIRYLNNAGNYVYRDYMTATLRKGLY